MGSEVAHKAFRYLIIGYFLTAVTSIYGVFAELGTLATGDNSSLFASFFLFSFAILGFVVVVSSQIWYFDKKGRLSVFEIELLGTSLKRVLILTLFSALILIYINVILISYEVYPTNDSEVSFLLHIPLILAFIAVGIVSFNVLFTLVGPVYVTLFYYFVVRKNQ